MRLRSGKPILQSKEPLKPKRIAFSDPLVGVYEYSSDTPTWLEAAIKQKDAAGIMQLLNDAQKKAEDMERRIHEMRLELQTIKYQQAHGLDIHPSSSKDATSSPIVEDPPSDDEDAEGLYGGPVVEYPASDDDEPEAWKDTVTVEVDTQSTGRKRFAPYSATSDDVDEQTKRRRQEHRENIERRA